MDTQHAPLSGKLIIVTGASSGVGYAAARRLAQAEGATVVAVARRRVFRIEALARQLREQTGEERLRPLTADIAAPGEAQALMDGVLNRYGRIDAFVHAVHRVLRLTALEVSDHEFDLTMQVNVKSALYGVQAVETHLKDQGRGAIVIYNPRTETTPDFAASEAVYNAAAHALSALSFGWSRQLEPCGVAVREVRPLPDGETLLADPPTPHDALIVDALRETIGGTPLRLETVAEAPPRDILAPPLVLSRRGGLALTQFG